MRNNGYSKLNVMSLGDMKNLLKKIVYRSYLLVGLSRDNTITMHNTVVE